MTEMSEQERRRHKILKEVPDQIVEAGWFSTSLDGDDKVKKVRRLLTNNHMSEVWKKLTGLGFQDNELRCFLAIIPEILKNWDALKKPTGAPRTQKQIETDLKRIAKQMKDLATEIADKRIDVDCSYLFEKSLVKFYVEYKVSAVLELYAQWISDPNRRRVSDKITQPNSAGEEGTYFIRTLHENILCIYKKPLYSVVATVHNVIFDIEEYAEEEDKPRRRGNKWATAESVRKLVKAKTAKTQPENS